MNREYTLTTKDFKQGNFYQSLNDVNQDLLFCISDDPNDEGRIRIHNTFDDTAVLLDDVRKLSEFRFRELDHTADILESLESFPNDVSMISKIRREEIATATMQGLLADSWNVPEKVARKAVELADSLIKELDK